MANTTGTVLINDLLLKWGNIDLTVYGKLFVGAMNDAILDFATGDYTFDLPSLEKTLTTTIPSGTTNPQKHTITGYSDEVWVPVHWHDITNDEPLIVANEGMKDLELDSSEAQTRINRYYMWGDSLYIAPNISTAIQVRLTYIGQTSALAWNETSSTVDGNSPFKTPWDEGLKLATSTRVALTLNPELEQPLQAQLSRWVQRRITQRRGERFSTEQTIWPQTS